MYLVWLAILGNGWGGFGGNNSAVQGAITRSDLFDGFNNQDVNSALRNLGNGLCDGFYSMNNAIKDNTSSLGSQLAENRFASQQSACAITNAIHSEGEETRALITSNTMQELRDRLEAKDRELLTAQFQLSQQAQTANLINQLQPVSKPAYITCSPYASSSCCGSIS